VSEVEIPPANPGYCQWIEVVKGARARVVRMYRCGEPVAGVAGYCPKHLALRNWTERQCQAPGADAPGKPAGAEGERLTFRRPWPPGYDSGCDHD
jgi:hypothetical protein